jgi:NAD(P)-dependent dehydrogenase (short-subunit alcohol dehydrogenase family)
MSKTIVVVGYGPGISTGVAEAFGAAGFNIALVGRTKDRLDAGVAALAAKNITARAFPADAGDPASIRSALGAIRSAFGPLAAIHWNAYGSGETGNLLTADPAELAKIFDVSITGLVTAVADALPDLKAAGNGAVLITNGAFGDLDPNVDAFAVQSQNMGLALANAAKKKLVGMLIQQLKPDNVYVGEVMIAGAIKGTAWATGNPNAIEPATVGAAFLELYTDRTENYVRLS